MDVTLGSPIVVSSVVILAPVKVTSISGGSGGSSLWTGEGPPDLVVGSKVGDEYLDVITGILYTLNEG